VIFIKLASLSSLFSLQFLIKFFDFYPEFANSPFWVYVKCPPAQLNAPIKVIKDVQKPVGLTLTSKEEIIVANKDKLVVLYSNLTKINNEDTSTLETI